jgi:hypothetical protein
MSANLLEMFTAYAGARELPAIETAFRPERRRRARTQVHWPVVLLRERGTAVETTTQNLSSSGFYCLVTVPLTPGESFACALRFPAHDPKDDGRGLTLQCTVQVMRVEATSEGVFGVACRIEDYHLVSGIARTGPSRVE